MRRSLASAAMAGASSRCGVRSRSRAVTSTGAGRTGALGSLSMSVIAGSCRGRISFGFDCRRACVLKAKRGAGIPSPLLETRLGPAGSTDAGGPDLVHRLFGRCLRHRLYRYEDAALGFGTEFNMTVHEREQGVVLAKADILARVPLGAALARNDVAGDGVLTAKQLQTQPLAVRIAAVARGAACFLVCHGIDSFSRGAM